MGIDIQNQNLPESFLSKLPIEERRKLGRAGLTYDEAIAKYAVNNERELQRDVSNYLNKKQIPFLRPRMDKKSTLQVGSPDFVACVTGKFVAIECKCRATGGKLTDQQKDAMGKILSNDGSYLVVYSIEELIRALSEIKALHNNERTKS
jgi:hypothetical protein